MKSIKFLFFQFIPCFAESAAQSLTGQQRMPNAYQASGLQAEMQIHVDAPLTEPSTPPLHLAASNVPVVANSDWGQGKIITNTAKKLTLGNLLFMSMNDGS